MDPISSRKSTVQTRTCYLKNSINYNGLGIVRANNILINFEKSNTYFNNIRNQFMIILNMISMRIVEGIRSNDFDADSDYIWGPFNTRNSSLRTDLYGKKSFFHRTWLDAVIRQVIDVPGSKSRKGGTLSLPIADDMINLLRAGADGQHIMQHDISNFLLGHPVHSEEVVTAHIVSDLMQDIDRILFDDKKSFRGNFIFFIIYNKFNFFFFF